MKTIIIIISLLLIGCEFSDPGHCYFFAADYLANGDAKHWPAYGYLDDALDHIAPGEETYRDDEIVPWWLSTKRCVANVGNHFVALRDNNGHVEQFDFLNNDGWTPFDGYLTSFVCMDK